MNPSTNATTTRRPNLRSGLYTLREAVQVLGSGETVKTTVDLPIRLWRAAKVRAMDDRTDLRQIVIAALETHLKPKNEAHDEGSQGVRPRVPATTLAVLVDQLPVPRA